MKKILIVEDDPAIVLGLKDTLNAEGFYTASVEDGEKGFVTAKNEHFDLIILDLMLPFKNGIDVCKDLRKESIATPIIMLTSKKEEVDKILGLEIGADDYMTKPFSIRELIARIKAILRRSEGLNNEIFEIKFGDVKLDFRKQTALKNGKSVQLSSTEFKIMKYLVQHQDEVISRNKFLDEVWGYDVFPTTRTVDNYILSLRKLLEDDPAEPRHIITVHKVGYKFVIN